MMLPIVTTDPPEAQERIRKLNGEILKSALSGKPMPIPPVIRARRRQSRMPNAKEIQAAAATEPQKVEIRNYTSGQISALREVANMILYRRRSLV